MEEKSEDVNVSSETVKEIEEDRDVENLKKVEAALFLSARFLSLQDLIMLTDINPLMLKELIEKLIEKYNREDSAIEIVIKNNMWKMDVSQEYVGMVNKLATGSSEFSKAEQETLAVIAYKQPVKQSVVVKIRGNKAYDHIKHFTDIGLLQAKRIGHTKELRLSDDFFEYFHLQKKGDGSIVAVENETSEEIPISDAGPDEENQTKEPEISIEPESINNNEESSDNEGEEENSKFKEPGEPSEN